MTTVLALLIGGIFTGVFGAAAVVVGIRRREVITALAGIAGIALGTAALEYAATLAVIEGALS